MNCDYKNYDYAVMCLFSGGYDSTFMMIQNLEKGRYVYPIYVDTIIDDTQKEMEKERAQKIVELLKEKFPNQVNFLDIMNMSWHVNSHNALNQPQLWVTAAYLNSGDISSKNIREIQIGYVMEDHALSYLKEIKNLYNAHVKFSHIADGWIAPKLVFPIIKWAKWDSASYLHDKYPEIFKLCCCCESPHAVLNNGITEYKPCGHCHSCQRMKNEKITNLLDKQDQDDFYKDWESEYVVAVSKGRKKIKAKKIDPYVVELEYKEAPKKRIKNAISTIEK
jgi:7-cyano-7-deazaguanine synthase in queuosine biosynthesis